MDNMTASERAVFHRPAFDPNGRLAARRELRFGAATYAPGMPLPPAAELGLDERAVRVLWEQLQVDTYPAGATCAVEGGVARWTLPDPRPTVRGMLAAKRAAQRRPGAAPHAPMLEGGLPPVKG